MSDSDYRTFWDIEKERTWRIYALFGFLFSLHLAAVFIVWTVIKLSFYIRMSFSNPQVMFTVFGPESPLIFVIAGVAAAAHWHYSSARVVSRVLHLLRARAPDPYDRYHSIFQNVVDEIEVSAGGEKVERYVLPTGAMNAFALADSRGRRVIGVTEGLLSRLSRDELQSVVAHEMAHIVSEDCAQVTMTCSLAAIYSEMLAQFNRVLTQSYSRSQSTFDRTPQKSFAGYVGLAVPVFVLAFTVDMLSQLLNMFISRQREYRADAAAVKLTRNPLALASALYKIGTHWRGAGYGGEHLSPVFILSPKFERLDEEEGFLATLLSTHPPLLKRLQVILRLAHADLQDITERLRKETRVRREVAGEKPETQLLIEHEKKWLGPFTILQLQTIDWLTPETRLRAPGSDGIMSASEVPALGDFFRRRSEPISKVKRLCPTCREWLLAQEYEGLYVWRCAFCNGMLAQADKLPRIFARREKGFTERVQRAAALLREDAKQKHPRFQLILRTCQPRRCPRCGESMMRKLYSYAYHVEIDRCDSCGVVWFDENELEILQCLIETEGDAPDG